MRSIIKPIINSHLQMPPSKIKRQSVNKVITSAGLKSNEGRNGITAWSHSKTANVATVLDNHAFATKTENSLLRKKSK